MSKFADYIKSLPRKSIIALTACGTFANIALADDIRDYGEYLAGECTACHSTTGADKGIPSIIGWDIEGFVETLKYYKSGQRENPAMVDVAKNLDDEQMTALATYFGSLEEKEEKEEPAEVPAAEPDQKSEVKAAE